MLPGKAAWEETVEHLPMALHELVQVVPSHHVMADYQLGGGGIVHGVGGAVTEGNDRYAELVPARPPGEDLVECVNGTGYGRAVLGKLGCLGGAKTLVSRRDGDNS